MKKIKLILSLLLIAFLALSVCACGAEQSAKEPSKAAEESAKPSETAEPSKESAQPSESVEPSVKEKEETAETSAEAEEEPEKSNEDSAETVVTNENSKRVEVADFGISVELSNDAVEAVVNSTNVEYNITESSYLIKINFNSPVEEAVSDMEIVQDAKVFYEMKWQPLYPNSELIESAELNVPYTQAGQYIAFKTDNLFIQSAVIQHDNYIYLIAYATQDLSDNQKHIESFKNILNSIEFTAVSSSGDISVSAIDAALQGKWTAEIMNGGYFEFKDGKSGFVMEYGSVTPDNYTIDLEEEVIRATFKATDGKTTAILPFSFENGDLILFLNEETPLTKVK